METTQSSASTAIAEFRRGLIRGAIGAFSLAAAVGIAAILQGELGETESRLAGSGLAFSLSGVLAAPSLLLIERRSADHWILVGAVGAAACGLALLASIAAIWNDDYEHWDLLWSFVIVALTCDHAALLKTARRDRDGDAVTNVTVGTIAAGALLGLMALIAVHSEQQSEGAEQFIAILAILVGLGSILIPLIRRLEPDRDGPAGPVASDPVESVQPSHGSVQSRVESLPRPVGSVDPETSLFSLAQSERLLIVEELGSAIARLTGPEADRPGAAERAALLAQIADRLSSTAG